MQSTYWLQKLWSWAAEHFQDISAILKKKQDGEKLYSHTWLILLQPSLSFMVIMNSPLCYQKSASGIVVLVADN
jgi:hypothetical protein